MFIVFCNLPKIYFSNITLKKKYNITVFRNVYLFYIILKFRIII